MDFRIASSLSQHRARVMSTRSFSPIGAPAKPRCFLKPGLARRQPPGMSDSRIRRIPADRLVLDIHDLVVGVEQFDAMAVRVAHVDVHRVSRPMPPRTALDASAKAEFARDIA